MNLSIMHDKVRREMISCLQCFTSESSNPGLQCITSAMYHVSESRTICSWSRELSQVFSILVPSTPPPPRHHSMMIHCVDHLFLISAAPCVLTIHSRFRQLCIIQFWLHQLSCTICCTVCTIFAETLPTKSENGVLRKAVCSASDVRVLFLLYSCPVFALFCLYSCHIFALFLPCFCSILV